MLRIVEISRSFLCHCYWLLTWAILCNNKGSSAACQPKFRIAYTILYSYRLTVFKKQSSTSLLGPCDANILLVTFDLRKKGMLHLYGKSLAWRSYFWIPTIQQSKWLYQTQYWVSQFSKRTSCVQRTRTNLELLEKNYMIP